MRPCVQYNNVMKLLTYNIHGWRTADGRPNLDMVAEVITDTGADIVGLNEVFYPRVVDGANAPALEALAAHLDMHFVFGPCLRWPVQDDMPDEAYGNALLSRWPIIASAAHHLTPKEEALQKQLVGKEQRGLLEGRILLPNNGTFTVYVTHLDHTDEDARTAQLRTLRTWTSRDRNRPHVVVGDFNTINLWDFAQRQAQLSQLAQRPGSQYMVQDDGPRIVAQMEKAGYTDVFTRFWSAC